MTAALPSAHLQTSAATAPVAPVAASLPLWRITVLRPGFEPQHFTRQGGHGFDHARDAADEAGLGSVVHVVRVDTEAP